jgi:hypothetical protein
MKIETMLLNFYSNKEKDWFNDAIQMRLDALKELITEVNFNRLSENPLNEVNYKDALKFKEELLSEFGYLTNILIQLENL